MNAIPNRIVEKDFPHRQDFVDLNENFKAIEEATGVALEYAHLGDVPDDCTGDSIHVAFAKYNRNFDKIERVMGGK